LVFIGAACRASFPYARSSGGDEAVHFGLEALDDFGMGGGNVGAFAGVGG
jgi:hypothetical protein